MNPVELHDVLAMFRKLARCVIVEQHKIAYSVRELGDFDQSVIGQRSILFTELWISPCVRASENERRTSRVTGARSGETEIHDWSRSNTVTGNVKEQAGFTVDVDNEVKIRMQPRLSFAVFSGSSHGLIGDGRQSRTVLPCGSGVANRSPDAKTNNQR